MHDSNCKIECIKNNALIAFLFAGGISLGFGNTWSHELTRISDIALILAALCILIANCNSKNWSYTHWGAVLVGLGLVYSIAFTFLDVATVDANNNIHINNKNWLFNYSKMCLAALLLGLSTRSVRDMFSVVLGFSITTFFLVIAFAIATWNYSGKTVYGHIYNALDRVDINSAGMMSLLIVLPCFLSALFIIHNDRKNLIKISVFFTFLLASILAYCFESRSVFIILYLLIPIQLICLGIAYSRWKIPKFTIFRCMGLSLVIVIVIAALEHLKRPIGTNIVHDGRIKMLSSFIHQLLINPFNHALVPKEIQFETTTHYFHNFFADAHRLSGFWGFLSAVILVAFIGYRTLTAAQVSDFGKVMLLLFIPTFLILNTSVVPEGEFQPILLILLIGGCSESILRSLKISPHQNAVIGVDSRSES